MAKTIKELVAEHRERKNTLAAQICSDHDLPPMTWEGLGTWVYRNGILVDLLFPFDDAFLRVDGNNYARTPRAGGGEGTA